MVFFITINIFCYCLGEDAVIELAIALSLQEHANENDGDDDDGEDDDPDDVDFEDDTDGPLPDELDDRLMHEQSQFMGRSIVLFAVFVFFYIRVICRLKTCIYIYNFIVSVCKQKSVFPHC